MKSGNIVIEHVDTGCWIVPDNQMGNAYNTEHITAIEVDTSDDDDKCKLVAWIHRGREIQLYQGTLEQCVRMSNKILDAIMNGMTVIRVWKLGLDIDAEDESGSSQAIIDATK